MLAEVSSLSNQVSLLRSIPDASLRIDLYQHHNLLVLLVAAALADPAMWRGKKLFAALICSRAASLPEALACVCVILQGVEARGVHVRCRCPEPGNTWVQAPDNLAGSACRNLHSCAAGARWRSTGGVPSRWKRECADSARDSPVK